MMNSWKKITTTLLWGNSIALSWIWGLGLFFSIQFTIEFGARGLFSFVITNCLGLFLFGLLTNRIATRSHHHEGISLFFTKWSRPFRLAFLLYQISAISLTIFALIRYAWQPLGFQPNSLYLPLTTLVILAASILFGEEFTIKKIKFSHGVMCLILLGAIGILFFHLGGTYWDSWSTQGLFSTNSYRFLGYFIPIIIGFLLGPWLDLQQWQRALQIRREGLSITASYGIGAIIFGFFLLFHGGLALWGLSHGGKELLHTGIAGYHYSEDLLSHLFATSPCSPWILGAYLTFLAICGLSTLDSGYIALGWFFQSNMKRSKHPIFSLIPTKLVTSPIPVYLFCGLLALCSAALNLELEYWMIFFATFFVGYEALALERAFDQRLRRVPQIKMFCVGSLAIVVFSYGYFLHQPLFQILGSIIPIGYVVWLMIKPSGLEEINALEEKNFDEETELALTDSPVNVATSPVSLSSQTLWEGSFEDKWFCYSFITTYADTNSVGNVYFGMYGMWVGKTRELFFNKVMPDFNLKETSFYILTRFFEHKFARETKEFEHITVKIKVADYNRKFVTLEHRIFNTQGELLGKGKQGLLFVSSQDYKMIDIPEEVLSAFMQYT